MNIVWGSEWWCNLPALGFPLTCFFFFLIKQTLNQHVDICHGFVTMEIRALLGKIPLCVNSLVTMVPLRSPPSRYLSVHLSGRCGCRATKSSNCLLSLVVCYVLSPLSRYFDMRGHFFFFLQLSLTRIRIHVWGSQHSVTRWLFAVPACLPAEKYRPMLPCDCLHRPEWYLPQQRASQCFSSHIVLHYTDEGEITRTVALLKIGMTSLSGWRNAFRGFLFYLSFAVKVLMDFSCIYYVTSEFLEKLTGRLMTG